MVIMSEQRLAGWTPLPNLEGMTPSFGDITIHSPHHQNLKVTLPYEEGELRIEFMDARTFEDAASRPGELFKVEASRWLSSAYFSLDLESSLRLTSEKPGEHFCILSGERSLRVAARDDIEALWVPQ